ncbi:MAG: ABC transporter ATP-binding protein, partial [Lachnospiraceae bacterium]|nr:ABC transporter ATP-binding protein [Lachnospiraceae bacterium]
GPISEMVVNNIDFSYSGQGTKIIEEISFHVRSGEMIGIAGSMGMGKTTLLKLLAGYENPDSGEVIGFTDAPDGKRRLDLTNRISTVFQETSLFSGTVRDNLLLAKPDATDTEIEVALKVAQAFEFIDELPDKLESKLSKMGKNLSGGQRQRLSIARAILSGKEILLLDDSFSALDYLTESKIRAELLNRKKDHIIFLSSQRIASLMAADKILVLENGRLIGFDKHEKLISSCAAYQELCRSQGIE